MNNTYHRAAPFVIIFILLCIYLFTFVRLETKSGDHWSTLDATYPHQITRIISGYLRQLAGDTIFIKTAVFVGGREPRIPPESYIYRLASHYDAALALQPKLKDIYFYIESYLAWAGEDGVNLANELLIKGMPARPDLWQIPYFIGFNYFYHLHDPAGAVQYLQKVALIRGNEGTAGKLATILLSKGGEIGGALVWLKTLQEMASDIETKEHYQKEINIYEQAWWVFLALEEFNKNYGHYPSMLSELVPQYLISLPDFSGSDFTLVYEKPTLRIHRAGSDVN